MKTNRLLIFASIIFLGGITSSIILINYKLKALAFHSRDYPYYIQFAAKLLDPHLSKRYSLNPNGHNAFGFFGTEGEKSFYQAIHFEPVKYIYAVLYRAFNNPMAVFVFIIFIFYLPLLYIAKISPHDSHEDTKFLILLFLLFLLYPSTILTPGFDLRPYVLLSPMFIIAFFSIYRQRPIWENLLYFNAMFLIREEALVFGLFLILWTVVYLDKKDSKPRIIKMTTSWGVWFVLILVYFFWTGYSLRHPKLPILILLLVAIIGILPAYRIFRSWLNRKALRQKLILGTYSLIFLPILYQFARSLAYNIRHRPRPALEITHAFSDLIFGARYNILFALILVFIYLVWFEYKSPGLKKKIIKGMLVSLILFAVIQGIYLPSKVKELSTQAKEATIVFNLRAHTDKYRTWLLTDYYTYQAFYDYEHVIVYNRLPWYMVKGTARLYPSLQSIHILRQLLKSNLEYIVINKISLRDIKFLIKPLKTIKLALNKKNSTFIIYRIIRIRRLTNANKQSNL